MPDVPIIPPPIDPDLISPMPRAANLDSPTGTPMDLAPPDAELDMNDPMAAGLAAFFEHQAQFKHPTPGVETASAAPAQPSTAPTPPAGDGAAQGGQTSPPGSVPPPPSPPATPPEGSDETPPVPPQQVPPAVPPVTPPEPSATPPAATPPGTVPAPDSGEAPPPPAPPVTPPESWVPAGHVLIGERPIPESDLTNLLQVYDWSRSLPPESAQAINDLLSGQFVLVPRSQYDPASGRGAPPTPAYSGSGVEPSSATPPQEYLDPQLAAQVEQLRQQQAQLVQQQQQFVAQQQAQQRQALEAQVEAGKVTFQTAMSLSAPEVHYLTDKATRMQLLPSLIREHGGDVSKGMHAALEAAYWADPEFRGRHTTQEIDDQVDQTMLANQALNEKKQRAASLAGTSNPVVRTPPTAAPLTKETATRGMVNEIAAALSNGSPNGN